MSDQDILKRMGYKEVSNNSCENCTHFKELDHFCQQETDPDGVCQANTFNVGVSSNGICDHYLNNISSTEPTKDGDNRIGHDLCSIIIEEGFATKEDCEKYDKVDEWHNIAFGEWLVDNGHITDRQLGLALSITSGYPFRNGASLISSDNTQDLVPMEFARTRDCLPVSIFTRELNVAIYDPFDLSLVDDLNFLTNMAVIPFISTKKIIQEGIKNSYNTMMDV